MSSTTDALDEFQVGLGSQIIGATIMRIRVNGILWTDAPAVGSSNAAVTWGFLVENENTITSGSASIIRRHADWMWHESNYFIHGDADTLDGAGWQRIDRDIRAKRRLDEMGDTLRFQISIGPGSTNPTTLRWIMDWSVLVALP